MAKKQVINKCTVETTLPLDYLTVLQGDLKILSDEAYKKLKKSILKHGFIFPFFVWDDSETNRIFILDGTQRYTTLKRMKKEGFSLPQFPVIQIEADNLQDAKEKLLSAASSYGQFNKEGVEAFLFDLKDLSFGESVEIPFLDFKEVKKEKDEKKTEVKSHERSLRNNSTEVDLSKFEKFDCECPKCGFQWNNK